MVYLLQTFTHFQIGAFRDQFGNVVETSHNITETVHDYLLFLFLGDDLGFDDSTILFRIAFVKLYPAKFLKSSLFPFTAAARAFVAEGAAFGRLRATRLNGKYLNAFFLFSPTIMPEFLLRFSAILPSGKF